MAYALVGSVGTVSTGASPITPAFAQATTAGNLLIAWVISTTSASGITATSGWFGIGSAFIGGANVSVFYKNNSGAGETAPTFTCASTTIWAALAEFSGGLTVTPADKASTNVTGTTSPVVAATSAADTASGNLVVTAGVHSLTMTGTTTTADTYNNGATPTSNLNNDATSSATHYRFAWGVTTGNSAADQTSHSDTSGNLSRISVSVASFKPAVAAAAAIPDVGMALTVT